MIGLATLSLCGCHVNHAAPSPAPLISHQVPEVLKNVGTGLDRLIILSVLVIGVVIAVFFILPEAHRLSITIGTGAGSVLAISLFLKTTLWMVPWIAGGLLILAVLVGIYEVYVNYFQKAVVQGVMK